MEPNWLMFGFVCAVLMGLMLGIANFIGEP